MAILKIAIISVAIHLFVSRERLFSERNLVIVVWDSVHARYHFISLVWEGYSAGG
jgi:hypothetical protein